MEFAKLSPVSNCVGTIRPPGSKSLTNRALVCAALAKGDSILNGVLESEDTEVMIHAWREVGVELDWDRARKVVRVKGCSGRVDDRAHRLFVGNSGTTLRFLTAALAAMPAGDFILEGVPRMHERPVSDLLEALNQIGARCTSLNTINPKCPPVQIRAKSLDGGICQVAGSISSQFLSGLLMAAPYAKHDTTVQVQGELVSAPYVEMTTAVMRSFGVKVEGQTHAFSIPGRQVYLGCQYDIEPDASAASYYFAAAALTEGRVTVQGLSKSSLQGDVAFCEVMKMMGCKVEYHPDSVTLIGGKLRGVDIDMNSISDTVQTWAVVAMFANSPSRVRGVAHNRHKETDRIGDLARELRKAGAEVLEHEDGLSIIPGAVRSAEFETYNDHRMAMSLALVGLRCEEMWVRNPACTAKTYPNYFEEMSATFGMPLAFR